MSSSIVTDDLLVELSTEQQEVLGGGYRGGFRGGYSPRRFSSRRFSPFSFFPGRF
ncbi:hypothetical protein NIES4074_42710 [Cylindrospermum sp. NIES-4074]|nr:hypothetical protein NIES4074_42710 [Cylindrospermum sp. NIES-4074]